MTELDVAPTAAENAAWVEFNIPMQVDELKLFCTDIERMFRINPHLEFTEWEKLGENHYRVAGKNTSQEPAIEFGYEFTVDDSQDVLRVLYKDCLKLSTTFKAESSELGAKLTIIDEYHVLSDDEAKAREGEIDRSLEVWANYLMRYMLTWTKWSWLSPWRWYMQKVWLPMKPMARRITYTLIWITLFEMALIALGVAVYYAEYA